MLEVDCISKVKAITMRTEEDSWDGLLFKKGHLDFVFKLLWCGGTSYSLSIYNSDHINEDEIYYFESNKISDVKSYAKGIVKELDL